MPDDHGVLRFEMNEKTEQRRGSGGTTATDGSLATVPTKPSAAMLASGARAGGVSVEVAWRVYQAMVQESR